MKKGFSLVTLLVTIFVIIILTSTVVISANSIYNSNKKVKFASEISYIKELVNSYMVNNNGNLPSNSEVITSIRDISTDEMQSQFQDEDISNENTIVLNKIDMSMINPGTLQYGNGTEEKSDDIYCISKKTGRIYYARGCKIGSKTYYTLTDELKKAIKYTESNNINDGIIFCDGNLESGIKEIDVKIPESYLDIEITSSDASFEYSLVNSSYSVTNFVTSISPFSSPKISFAFLVISDEFIFWFAYIPLKSKQIPMQKINNNTKPYVFILVFMCHLSFSYYLYYILTILLNQSFCIISQKLLFHIDYHRMVKIYEYYCSKIWWHLCRKQRKIEKNM